jgi:hypothetical protein
VNRVSLLPLYGTGGDRYGSCTSRKERSTEQAMLAVTVRSSVNKVQSSTAHRGAGWRVVFSWAFPAVYEASAATGLRSPPPHF